MPWKPSGYAGHKSSGCVLCLRRHHQHRRYLRREEGRGKDVRVVPNCEMFHAERAGGPLIVVREARGVEQLDDHRDGRDRHHDEVRQTISVHAHQELQSPHPY